MRSAFFSRSMLVAASLLAGCAGHQGASALIPGVAGSGGAPTLGVRDRHVRPDGGLGVVRFHIHDGEACSYIVSDGAGKDWYSTCYNYVDKTRLIAFNESTRTFSQYILPKAYKTPHDLAVGPNNHGLWFTDPDANRIGYFQFSHHVVKTFWFGNVNRGLYGITAGPDNAVWFCENVTNRIGRISMVGFSIKQYSAHADQGYPSNITQGRDGALWFVAGHSVIGRITTTGTVTRYQISYKFQLAMLKTGPDGAMWFAGYATGGRAFVGRMDLYTHKHWIFEYNDDGAYDMVARDSEIWLVDSSDSTLDSFSVADHKIIRFNLANTSTGGIALGSDNQLYLDDFGHQHLTKVCPALPTRQCGNSP